VIKIEEQGFVEQFIAMNTKQVSARATKKRLVFAY
jgi:hypothetical protein